MKEIKLNVVLQYDQETDTIVSYKATIDGVANKTTTTRKASKAKNTLEGCILVREEGKLVLSEALVADLGAEHEDRIAICYETVDEKYFPVIGIETNFGGKGSGNKLSKTNTVQFKGKQNETLAAFGTTFAIEPYGEGIFKLIGDVQGEATSIKSVKKEVNLDIETTEDTNYEIEEIDLFKL